MERPSLRLVALATSLALGAASTAAAQVPEYSIEIVGPGTLINDMNNVGEVVGWTTALGTGVQAWVAGPDHPFEVLPLPAGYNSAWAQGINDAGVVVGSASIGGFPEFGEATAWFPDGNGGYTTQVFGALPGHTQSVAYDVNNRGDIIGWSLFPGFQGGPTVWFNSPTGVVNLGELGAPSGPKQINDEGVIVGTNGGLFDIDTMQATSLPPLPPGWSGFQGWGIGEDGSIAGTAIKGSTKRAAAVWTPTGGWSEISLTFSISASVQAYDINSAGVAYGLAPQPIAFHEENGVQLLTDLLTPAQQQDYVFFTASAGAVNDAGQIATIALNTVTGVSGAAVLTPIGAPYACQTNLGEGGPGAEHLSVCGAALASGQSAELDLTGAEPFALAVLLIATDSTPLFSPALGVSTVVPVALRLQVANGAGEKHLTLQGGGGAVGVTDAYVQYLTTNLSSGSGAGWSTSNVIGIDLQP